MIWTDIASIVFICVTMNHLGLIKAIEEHFEIELRGVNCVKCSTFWCVLIYTVLSSRSLILPLAISFLCSYIALWLELFEGFIDYLYHRIYEKIYSESDNNTPSSVRDKGGTNSTMSEL